MKVRQLLRKLKDDGWLLDRVRGSHHVFKNVKKSGSVVVAYRQEGEELSTEMLKRIAKQAGWK